MVVGLGSIDWFSALRVLMYWLGYAVLGIFFLVAYWFMMVYMSFKYTMTYWEVYGGGEKGALTFSKPKTNKLKWNKEKTAWRVMKPWMNKEEHEPFDDEFIYHGRFLYALKYRNNYVPIRLGIEKEGADSLRGSLNVVPSYVRNWQSLQHKKNQLEFAMTGFWEENKTLIYMLLTVGLCLGLCGLTVWWTYKYSTGGTQAVNNLANVLKNVGAVPAR